MLIAVGGEKGSPGATTTAVALAAGWPNPAVVVEADPGGGDLALRLRLPSGEALPPTPTVLTLAAAARAHLEDTQLVVRHASGLSDRVGVIPGHLLAEQSAGMAGAWEALAAVLSRSDLDVIVDVGRLDSGSPAMPVAAAADAVVVVGRPTTAGGLRLRERIKTLGPALAARRGRPAVVWAVVVTPARHAEAYTADLNHMLTSAGIEPVSVGHLVFDAAAASRIDAGEIPTGRLSRTPLMRSARELASRLSSLDARHVARGSARPRNGYDGANSASHRFNPEVAM
jgi:MinD-like ATPase involved in chromosome partitioning or flagellar assembly